MDSNAAVKIAQERAQAFTRVSFSALAAAAVCIVISTIAGCVSNWVNAPEDKLSAALARCTEQPSAYITIKDPDRKNGDDYAATADAAFKMKVDAMQQCRALVFEFYKEKPPVSISGATK